VKISLAGAADAPAVVELLLAQLAEHAIHTPRPAVEHAVEGMLAEPRRGRIFVARDGDRLLGVAYVSFIWALEHGGHSAWLEELYVRPAAREHGIGSALLAAAIDFARADGCAALDLEVEEEHVRAANLYARNGFDKHSRTRWVRKLDPTRSP
jgi:GNAT superfamily N-acetyltransferase